MKCETGPDQCIQCDSSANAELRDGICVCRDGTFFDSASLSCIPCNESCETCSSLEKCDTCPIGFELGDTICLNCGHGAKIGPGDECTCLDSFFKDNDGSCQACEESCATCDSAEACTSCPEGSELGASVCLKCSADEYIDGDQCISCGANCL